MEKLFELLKEYTGMDKAEVLNCISVSENNSHYILTPISGYLEAETFRGVMSLVRTTGGDYEPRPLRFYVLKSYFGEETDSEVVATEPQNENQEDNEYSLAKSLRGKYGQIVPCLADAEGEVFDGKHRTDINPKAWTVKVLQIKTAVDRVFGRMIANKVRRRYASEELSDDIGFLIGAGFSIADIHSITGIHERTLHRHQPEHLKKPSADKISETRTKMSDVARDDLTTVRTKLKTQDMSVWSKCDRCGISTQAYMQPFGKYEKLCPNCFEKALANPDDFKRRPKAPVAPTKKPEMKEYKPTEPWEQRLAHMKTEVSEMDRYIYERAMQDPDLRERGFKVTGWKPYELTKSDVTIEKPGEEYVFFIDNAKIHQKRQVRDETITSVLQWQEAIQKGGVIRVPYEGSFSKAKGEQVYAKIKEALS